MIHTGEMVVAWAHSRRWCADQNHRERALRIRNLEYSHSMGAALPTRASSDGPR